MVWRASIARGARQFVFANCLFCFAKSLFVLPSYFHHSVAVALLCLALLSDEAKSAATDKSTVTATSEKPTLAPDLESYPFILAEHTTAELVYHCNLTGRAISSPEQVGETVLCRLGCCFGLVATCNSDN